MLKTSQQKTRISVQVYLAILMLGLLCSGCSLIKGTMELPDKAIESLFAAVGDGEKTDPVELQSQLLRFSDHYLDTLNSGTAKLRNSDNQRPEARTLLRRRIAVINDVLSIATGSNTYANLLDMVILVNLNLSNANYWMPKRYGDSALPLLSAGQDAEKEIWRIAESALNTEQIQELRNGIEAWRSQHSEGRAPRDIGGLGFATEIAKTKKTSQPGNTSVFNLLMIDPFAGLDPTTMEIANTRLFAERGLFLTRHMPTLLRLEAEMLAIQSAEIPQIENLLANINQLSTSVERFSLLSEQFPSFFSSEREEIIKALDAQRPGLISLAEQTEKALSAGNYMSEATTATLKTFQDVVKQLKEGPSDPNSEPFRIEDYTAAAKQISTAVEHLSEFLAAFNNTISPERLDVLSERMNLLNQQAQLTSKSVVDYAFNKLLLLGLILMILGSITVLATSLLYWRLKKRFAGAHFKAEARQSE